jgi:hypothetical protein
LPKNYEKTQIASDIVVTEKDGRKMLVKLRTLVNFTNLLAQVQMRGLWCW